ncbi:MAG: sodium:solute symporter family protein [Clostridiales Family XIII bacterium]|jgi:sodium/pantothenate symporter|nr:sodium:solute symporter family protein [Clostridiales Family XIII bacterium]
MKTLASPYIIGLIVLFALFIVVGTIMGRNVKNTADYYVAGRNAPTLLVTGSLIASYLSTVAFMGDTGFNYDGFLMPYVILCAVCSVGYIFGARYFGIYLRRSRVLTLPEFFGQRFDSKRIRMFTSIVTVVGIMCYLTSVTKGAALLMQNLLGLGDNPHGFLIGLAVTWAVYTAFTFYSGSKGILTLETIMFFVFTVMAFVSIPFIFSEAGGWPQSVTNTVVWLNSPDSVQAHIDAGAWAGNPDVAAHFKPGALSVHGVTDPASEWAYMGNSADTVVWAFVLGFVWLIAMATSPWQTSRYMMAKNEHVVVRTGLIGSVIALVILIFLDFAMTVANMIDIPAGVTSEETYVWLSLNLFPTWLGIIVISGLMSAALSSCSTFASLIGFSLANDILPAVFKKMNPDKGLRNGRILMVLSSVIVVFLTYYSSPAIMWVAYFASTLFAVSWGFVSFAGVWSKKISERGAFWSMFAGAAAFVLAQVLKTFAGVSFPTLLRPEILGMAAAVVVYFAMNRPDAITDAERKFFTMLHTQEDTEKAIARKEAKRTLRYAKFVIVSGVVVTGVLFVFYYLPYREGIAILNAGG